MAVTESHTLPPLVSITLDTTVYDRTINATAARRLDPQSIMSLNSMLGPNTGPHAEGDSHRDTHLPSIEAAMPPMMDHRSPPVEGVTQEMSLREHILAAQAAGAQVLHHQPLHHEPPPDRYGQSPTPSIAFSARYDPAMEASGYGPVVGDPTNEDMLGLDGKRNVKRELSSSKRAAQNRAAQRAFRQRKEEHIKQLEERAKDKEQLEQTISATKQENSTLRTYVYVLQQRLLEVDGKFPAPPPQLGLAESSSHDAMNSHHARPNMQLQPGPISLPNHQHYAARSESIHSTAATPTQNFRLLPPPSSASPSLPPPSSFNQMEHLKLEGAARNADQKIANPAVLPPISNGDSEANRSPLRSHNRSDRLPPTMSSGPGPTVSKRPLDNSTETNGEDKRARTEEPDG